MAASAHGAPASVFLRHAALGRAIMVAVTLLSSWLTATRLHISTDLSLLFPEQRESAALARFSRVFVGGDGCLILVRAPTADEARDARRRLVEVLRTLPSVDRVLDGAPNVSVVDPTSTWRYAGPSAREALAKALTPSGMRERLAGTRALLLAPGSSDAEAWLARDPLRLATIPWEERRELAAGVVATPEGAFEADAGKAQLVVVQPRGSPFDGLASAAFMADFAGASREVRATHPTATVDVTGGHAIASATEAMFKVDLALSSALSLVAAALVFVLTFGRPRALLAVMPPLVAGTVWTTALASFLPHGLSGVAVAFTAVVVGVGVDTGVHVYAALLEGRRRGFSPREAAQFARGATWRPTLLAAIAAGLAFGSLGLSSLEALRQLGLLCGVGEFLTAVAILWMTPEIGALLERGEPPVRRPSGWTVRVVALTGTRRRAGVAVAAAIGIVALAAVAGWPVAGDAIVAIRPRHLAPLQVQESIYQLFGGRPGQWVVLSEGATPEAAEARADAIAETLDPLARDGTIDGFDALASYVPAVATQAARLRQRDKLDLPGLRHALSDALLAAGFDVGACAPALEAFLHPDGATPPIDGAGESAALAWLRARHLRSDGARSLAVTYVRPSGDPEKDRRALDAITAADPDSIVTGFPHLEAALRESLAHDLPRVALLACVIVAIALRAILGRTLDVAIALSTIVVEIAAVAVLMRLLHVPWHVYDALVLPVLVGVTIDESMFLLHAARARPGVEPAPGEDVDAVIGRALTEQGPLVVATALTTMAGFAALLCCKFEGLFDLGAVGALGVGLGLLAALVIVPAGLRLATHSR